MSLIGKLTKENYLLFAAKNYNNPEGTGMDDFKEDLARIVYIKRMLSRYHKNGVLTPKQMRLLLNHFIILYNVFDIEAATRLLFFGIDKKHWGILRTILVFLNYIDETTFRHKYYSDGIDIRLAEPDEYIRIELGKL